MTQAVIAVEQARFVWPGRQDFRLDIADFAVSKGERVLLSGPSGSGKSTLLSLVCGILRPASGRIAILGTELGRLSSVARDRFRAEHIGVIFQQFNLLPYATVRDNILLPLTFAPKRRARVGAVEREVADLLAALGLESVPPAARASDLSIGQQQRVAVARALIGRPELVVADEPTSALDAASQERFLDLMFAQLDATGSTLLMVSHDERLASRFSRVVQLAELMTAGPAELPAAPRERESAS